MKDRFRFRAWNKEEKKMYYDAQDTYDYMAGNPIIFAGSFGCLLTNDEEWEVEQCTGLKDKNGNLIYEGDLIKSPNNSHKLAIVRMENGVYGCKEFRFNGVWEMNLYDLIKHYGVEIIGNIHEQAEQKEQQ